MADRCYAYKSAPKLALDTSINDCIFYPNKKD